MDQQESQTRLATILEKQDDRLQKIESKLDAHEASERLRWEEHVKEHREHDRTHSDIAQRQLKIEDRLHSGAESFSDLRKRTAQLEQESRAPFRQQAAMIITALVLSTAIIGWFYSQLGTKADKSEVQAFNKEFLEAIEKVSKTR